MSTLIYILIVAVAVFIAGYFRGKTVQIKELKDMEVPEMDAENWCSYYDVAKPEPVNDWRLFNDENWFKSEQYQRAKEKWGDLADIMSPPASKAQKLKILDELMTDDNFFNEEENDKVLTGVMMEDGYEFDENGKMVDLSLTDDDTIPDSMTGVTYEQVKFGDDYFTGDLVKSSKTETEIVKQPINPKRLK